MALAFGMWWMYFDVVALVAERRLSHAAPGREQNEIPRDSFSYLSVALIPLAHDVEALMMLALANVLASGLVIYEFVRFRELRNTMRDQLHAHSETPIADGGPAHSDPPTTAD